MKTTTKLLGVALVALVAFTGFAAAGAGGFAAGTADQTPAELSNANVTIEQAQDGSNSPWVTGDERLELFQERFDLTDEQVATIQSEVQSMIENDASPTEIRDTVRTMLADYGVENPTLGPSADGFQGDGQYGHGHGHGFGTDAAQDGSGFGGFGGHGGYGNGHCLA
ncbi:hypothetical protein HTSR_0466 [Halodesulfurarchaeum formicicum]|uniref:DUF2680 domain-containing protein n=1 Tax=Halodesulfurarchaeum formicicum TaxID=1873524 RepID=A0A1D8S2T9_9EURY|nr:hypothetical protein [Halodesulfurarchaeum formicicum]AOW79665.1 hypothetical protein HTSR_0466 [Halodesulfurarchaeum formicicum]